MHTNRCVLIEISIEREIIDFLIGIIGHCTALMEENYFCQKIAATHGMGIFFKCYLRCDEKTFHDIRI